MDQHSSLLVKLRKKLRCLWLLLTLSSTDMIYRAWERLISQKSCYSLTLKCNLNSVFGRLLRICIILAKILAALRNVCLCLIFEKPLYVFFSCKQDIFTSVLEQTKFWMASSYKTFPLNIFIAVWWNAHTRFFQVRLVLLVRSKTQNFLRILR